MAVSEMKTVASQTRVLNVRDRYLGDSEVHPHPDVNRTAAALLREAADKLEALDGSRYNIQGLSFEFDPDTDPFMHVEIDLYDDQD